MTLCYIPWCNAAAPCPAHRDVIPHDERCKDCNGSATWTVAGAPVPCGKCHGSGRKKPAPPSRKKIPVDRRDLMLKMKP